MILLLQGTVVCTGKFHVLLQFQFFKECVLVDDVTSCVILLLNNTGTFESLIPFLQSLRLFLFLLKRDRSL